MLSASVVSKIKSNNETGEEEQKAETSPGCYPDPDSPSGNFYWFSPTANQLQTVADFGLLGGQGSLANQLAAVFGKRMFKLLHDKSKTRVPNWRKKWSLALGIAHREISDNKRMDLLLCWIAVQEIRVIQEMDSLLNQDNVAFFPEKIALIKSKLTTLQTKLGQYKLKGYSGKIIQHQCSHIVSQIALLQKLSDLSSEHPHVRNRKLHALQRQYFQEVIENFQYCQGIVGAYASIFPKENVSNSKTTQAAFYVLQEHIFQEINPLYIKPYFFYRPSHVGNHYVNASQVCPDSQQRKELLMGSLLAEALPEDADVTSFFMSQSMEQSGSDPLEAARKKYENLKAEIQRVSLEKKKQQIFLESVQYFWARLIQFLWSESEDPETELPLISREMQNWWDAVAFRNKKEKSIKCGLRRAESSYEEKSQHVSAESFVQLSFERDDNYYLVLLAPAAEAVFPDDLVTAILRFMQRFFRFFDEMMAEHPYLATVGFTLPALNIALPAVGFAQAAHIQLAFESLLAKYTGLNHLLPWITWNHCPPLTIENLQYAGQQVTAGLVWLTEAEDPIEKSLLGVLIAKIIFNISDSLLNNSIISGKDATFLGKFIGTPGTLEGTTPAENVISLCGTLIKESVFAFGVAQLVGRLEHASPICQATLSKLAFVPFDKLQHLPQTSAEVIQGLAISKSAALIIIKTMGIMYYIQQGQLRDIHGLKLNEDSHSAAVLRLFMLLALKKIDVEKIKNFPDFPALLEHFEQLIFLNPELLSYYSDPSASQEATKPTYHGLKELGVKLIRPKLRHKILMSFPKATGPLLDLIVPLLPLLLWLHPVGWLSLGAAWVITSLFLLPTFYALHCRFTSAVSQKPLAPTFPWLFQFGLKTQYTWAIFLKALWTGIKAIIHAPLKFALRVATLEVPVSLVMSLFVLVVGLFYLMSLTINKLLNCVDLTVDISSPVKKIYDSLRELNAVLNADFFRPLRYWIERKVGYFLRLFRDSLVRSVEQDIQKDSFTLQSTASMTHTMSLSGPSSSRSIPEKEPLSDSLVQFSQLFNLASSNSDSKSASFSIQGQLSEMRFKK